MSPDELLQRLIAAADDLGPIAALPSAREQLTAMCATTRVALGAQAVSVARNKGDVLVYEASDGRGAAEIVGVELSLGEGLAGYVARTGQAMVIDQVELDPRFARRVAEATGYIPTSMLITPVIDTPGDVIGVVSVLDRGAGSPSIDALAVASSVAAQAALLLPTIDIVARLAPVLLHALASAAESDAELADALRQLADDPARDDADLAGIAALLVELRTMSPTARATVERVLGDLLELARPRRR